MKRNLNATSTVLNENRVEEIKEKVNWFSFFFLGEEDVLD